MRSHRFRSKTARTCTSAPCYSQRTTPHTSVTLITSLWEGQMTYQLKSAVLEADQSTIRALTKIVGYAPMHPDLSLEAIQQLDAETEQASAEVEQILFAIKRLQHKLLMARYNERTLQMKRHKAVVAVRETVKVQFGDDSTELMIVGRTRKSDYKRPKRRPRSSDASKQDVRR